jgi:DNA-directed RNA polymerase sigma subunit (sigma70/sigma32)
MLTGTDAVTLDLIIEAHNALQRATGEYAELLAANRHAFAWMRDFPEERRAFVEQLRAAGVTLAVIGDLLGLSRERVRQLEAG